MNFPRSCDTFVVLPPCTKKGGLIFGKNSDRPQGEVQEVVYIKERQRNEKLKCTYITIDESPNQIHTVILSKPAWMWGAESGANDKNVVIGNEAVWTNNNDGNGDASQRRLIGMDLVRLGLERGSTADEALDVITALLEKYGQGGPCAEDDDSLFYHNSFLIADPTIAWVLETSGKLWAAEKIEQGYRNISNGLTIGTKIDKHSKGLFEIAQSKGFWDGQGDFNFTKIFAAGGDKSRQEAGSRLLKLSTESNNFDVLDMFDILRDKESNICMGCEGSFSTQGSQVSCLGADGFSVHWFTATADPSMSYFKPFVFTPSATISEHTVSPAKPNREHHLYKKHWKAVHLATGGPGMAAKLREMELSDIDRINQITRKKTTEQNEYLDNLMKNAVESELRLYAQ